MLIPSKILSALWLLLDFFYFRQRKLWILFFLVVFLDSWSMKTPLVLFLRSQVALRPYYWSSAGCFLCQSSSFSTTSSICLAILSTAKFKSAMLDLISPTNSSTTNNWEVVDREDKTSGYTGRVSVSLPLSVFIAFLLVMESQRVELFLRSCKLHP